MCDEPLNLCSHEPGDDPSQPVDIPSGQRRRQTRQTHPERPGFLRPLHAFSRRRHIWQGAHRLPARQAADRRAVAAGTRHALRPQTRDRFPKFCPSSSARRHHRAQPKSKRSPAAHHTPNRERHGRRPVLSRQPAFALESRPLAPSLTTSANSSPKCLKIRVTWEELDD